MGRHKNRLNRTAPHKNITQQLNIFHYMRAERILLPFIAIVLLVNTFGVWELIISWHTHTHARTQIVLLLLDNKTKWVAKFGNIRNELQKKIKHYLETWRSLRPRWHWNACIYRKNQITIKYNKIKADFSITMN